MYTRLIRVLLVVIAIAIVCSSAYVLREAELRINAARMAGDVLREQARMLSASIAEIRAAQAGYVAQGQGVDFWVGRVGKLVPAVQQQIAAFATALTAPGARVAIEQAAVAMENFQKLDQRVQDFVKSGNDVQAGDLIFSDGLESTNAAAAQIASSLGDELQARQAVIGWQRRLQLATLGAAAGGVLVIMLMLAFTGTGTVATPNTSVSRPHAQPIEIEPASVEPPQTITPPPPVPSLQPALASAADLCTELARVTESEQLPRLLERGAKLLDASGMIVWVAQPDGASLRPAMSFGYAQQTVLRMGAIHRDSNNAAAAAYRAGELRTVAGDKMNSGALVVPLLTSEGCIGVLSAEMKGGSEGDESSQAFAAILAAQLATLVSPPTTAAAQPKAAAQA